MRNSSGSLVDPAVRLTSDTTVSAQALLGEFGSLGVARFVSQIIRATAFRTPVLGNGVPEFGFGGRPCSGNRFEEAGFGVPEFRPGAPECGEFREWISGLDFEVMIQDCRHSGHFVGL